MKHRISAGALVTRDDQILMVRHMKQEAYDFWVPPGGGVFPGEDARSAAEREAREETGMIVEARNLALVEELEGPAERGCKLWFHCEMIGGEPGTEPRSAEREHIIDTRFVSRSELSQLSFFPPILNEDRFWVAAEHGFPAAFYLGLNEMEAI